MGFNSGFKGLKNVYSYSSTHPLGFHGVFHESGEEIYVASNIELANAVWYVIGHSRSM